MRKLVLMGLAVLALPQTSREANADNLLINPGFDGWTARTYLTGSAKTARSVFWRFLLMA